jgi:CDP-diglyceride synthetase
MSSHVLVAVAIAALIFWRLYYRMRRNFGRQPIRTRRMWTRVGILGAVTLLIVASEGFVAPRLLAGLAGGLVCGVALGMVALKLTRFEIDGRNDCYYPNVWVGLALTALFVGRLAYRFMVLWPQMQHAAAAGGPTWERSPLTLLILGLLLGYYLSYYTGLLIHHRRVLATLPGLQDGGSGQIS